MNQFLGTLVLACVFVSVMARAQQKQETAATPTRTTYVRLANNANAIIVEPASPDPRRSKVAVLVAHPGNANTFNYFIGRELSQRGYRVMMMNYYGPEQTYDEFLAPMSAAVGYLRGATGVEKIVLAGHSTGGPELTFYQDVAENGQEACQDPERLYPCRGTIPENLPPADGIMLLDSNAGAIERLIALDPSVDSRNPGRHNPELDMFNPSNGFSPDTGLGAYSAEFVRKYFRAQGARQNGLIEYASARLAKIEKGRGDYKDDEPFVIPGSSLHTYDGSRIDLADLRLLSKTHSPHLLLKANGTAPTQIVHSTRPPLSHPSDRDRMDHTTQNVTITHFLSFLAMRTEAKKYGLTEDGVNGVKWRSVAHSVPGNVQGIRVPSLFMAGDCAPHLVFTEIAYDLSAAKDKTFVGVEGADHYFRPCKSQYNGSAQHAFDYIDSWLMTADRF